MIRSKRHLAIFLAASVTLAIGGCHTTVVEHVDKHEPHPDRPDDHRPPPPPDNHDDHRDNHPQPR
jgi:hypothetical protein